MNANIPIGWTAVALEELLLPGGLFDGPFGSNLKTSDYMQAGIRVVRLENLGHLQFFANKETFISHRKYVSLIKHRVGEGDIMFGSFVDSDVRVCILPPLDTLAIAKADCFCIRSNEDLADRRFLAYYLATPTARDALVDQIHGATRPRINTKQLRQLRILLPPFGEQQRIAEKIAEALGKVQTSRIRLERVPYLLNRFRQSVLAAACDGRLTQDWRVTKAAVRPEVSLGEIASEIRTGPFGSALHKADYVTGGIPVINPMNLVAGKIVTSPNVSITSSTFKRLSEYALREGDVIIARRGEMGRCALVGPTEAGWLCGTGCAILRLKPEARPAYVELVISSPVTRAFLGEASVGTTMDNLNQKALRSMPIFLPELAEQDEIVQRVRSLYRFADRLESRLKNAKGMLDKVPQSILAKAFRGELVPTEAALARREGRDFESGAQLLDRIKTLRTTPMERKRRSTGVLAGR